MKSLNFKSKISIATGSFDTTSRKVSPSLPTLKLFMPKNIFNKMSIFSFINSYIIKHNMWSFGSLAGLSYIVIQIITGIFLAMHYTPHVDLAFNSVEHIMRDVNSLWNNDKIQFARLISVLESVGAFTNEIAEKLCIEMDLEIEDLSDIVDRAQLVFEKSNKKIK